VYRGADAGRRWSAGCRIQVAAGSILADRICHGARPTHYLTVHTCSAPSPARSALNCDGRLMPLSIDRYKLRTATEAARVPLCAVERPEDEHRSHGRPCRTSCKRSDTRRYAPHRMAGYDTAQCRKIAVPYKFSRTAAALASQQCCAQLYPVVPGARPYNQVRDRTTGHKASISYVCKSVCHRNVDSLANRLGNAYRLCPFWMRICISACHPVLRQQDWHRAACRVDYLAVCRPAM
jgi:hypothetical protein